MKSRPIRPRSSSHHPGRRSGGRRTPALALLALAVGVVSATTQPAKLTAAVSAPSIPRFHQPIALDERTGISLAVDLAVALPGAPVKLPLALGADSTRLRYAWVPVGDTLIRALAQPVARYPLHAPARPGFYHLALVRDTEVVLLDQSMLAVMVPFQEKHAGRINTYRIGTYRGEQGRSAAHPSGFLVVEPGDVGLPVSAHLRLGDFVAHDAQQGVWPKYLALDPRLLDKLELVMAELQQASDRSDAMQLEMDVHSGFRPPRYNRTVPRAADDSRHQYGDAADVVLDVDGDGRITKTDITSIVRAVDTVEARHPELAGGLGVYTSRRFSTPYVHIDTRGARTRWRG
jgi:uncharacterized protein YcbK (DUF882 family)